jgi:hypothetical protein
MKKVVFLSLSRFVMPASARRKGKMPIMQLDCAETVRCPRTVLTSPLGTNFDPQG